MGISAAKKLAKEAAKLTKLEVYKRIRIMFNSMDQTDVNGVGLGNLVGEECILGIDEAGRGPVLGPMVYGAGICRMGEEWDVKLKGLGVDDSKALTEDRRAEIFKDIQSEENQQWISYVLRCIPAQYISNRMLGRSKHSLNEISFDAAFHMIRSALKRGILVRKVFVDTVGPPETYQSKLEREFGGRGIEFAVAKKADSLYPIVSAASICAKVTRDALLADWSYPEGPTLAERMEPVGSGYPSAPGTKEFMQKGLDPVFGYPNVVRFSWSTAQDLMDKEAVPVKWEDDEDQSTPSVGNFLQQSAKKRHNYFRDRHLQFMSTF